MKLQDVLPLRRALGLLRPRTADPTVLAERVRACLGRVASHPGAIHVSIEEPRRVVLRGWVLAWEHAPLRRAVGALAGVGAVRDELSVHESADQIGALQGASRGEQQIDRPGHWSPGVRLLAAVAGGSLLLGTRRRGALSALGAAAGGALLLRSVVNAPLRHLARGRPQRLELHKSLQVQAPVERVFAALRDCERVPDLLPSLRQVRRRADGTTHWIVDGPGARPLEWDTVTTQLEVNRLLAWRTTQNSALTHWGMLRFEDDEAGHTRLHVHVSCQRPAGRLGQAVTGLFGTAPGSGLSAALLRLKRSLEAAEMAPRAAPAQNVD